MIKAAGLALAIALTATVPAHAQYGGYPPKFFDFRLATWLANYVADNCGDLSFSMARMKQDWQRLVTEIREDGDIGKLKHFRTRFPEELFHPAFFKFAEKHKIFDDSPEAVFCTAGRAEMSARSDIGKYLR